MQTADTTTDIRETLQKFQEGYTLRDLSTLDEFMDLFEPGSDTELIGIGASVRGGKEWFQGFDQIRAIVASDWEYWGEVRIDVQGAKISTLGDATWRFHTIHWSMPVD